MDLESAAALHGTSVEDMLSTLAVEASEQYETPNKLQLINAAVRFARGAVARTCSNDPDLGERKNELGGMLESRYEPTGALSDLEEATEISRHSITSTPGSGTDGRVILLNNLGNMLEILFEETGLLAHLQSAIHASREALAQLSSADADQELCANLVGNLANKMSNRYEATKNIANIEEALRLANQALELIPEDGIDQPLWTNSLGVSLS